MANRPPVHKAGATPFNQTAITPQPFRLGIIPIQNLTKVPVFLQTGGFQNGSAPGAPPAIGLQPPTAKAFLGGLLSRKK